MYSQVDDGSESITFDSVTRSNITDDPFFSNTNNSNDRRSGGGSGGGSGGADFEPLNPADAARRLLGNDDEADNGESSFAMGGSAESGNLAPVMGGAATTGITAAATSTSSNNASNNVPTSTQTPTPTPMQNSLFERIQQQKQKNQQQQQQQQQQSVSFAPDTKGPTMTHNNNNNNNSVRQNVDSPFGYPTVQETNYSNASNGNNTNAITNNNNNNNSGGVNIPQYSSDPTPQAYYDANADQNTIMSNLLATFTKAANGAVTGTKYIYHKITTDSNATSSADDRTSSTAGSNINMAEMDYQRESLLMDPHDLEDHRHHRTNDPTSTFDAPSSSSTTSRVTGMIGGLEASAERDGLILDERGGSSLDRRGSGTMYKIMVFMKQFCVDVKDLYLGASRNVQVGAVLLGLFILWLLFSEV